ncbi:MAG: hypothetical protein V1782_02565, partial [Pseudomonadota bacterium]
GAAQKAYDQGQYQEARAQLAELRTLAPAHPGAAELAKRVEAAIEKERLALYRSAAFADEALAQTKPKSKPGRMARI